MNAIILFAVTWPTAGLVLYHWARRSWISRWGTDDAPFNYPVAAILGPGMAGAALAEWRCRKAHRK